MELQIEKISREMIKPSTPTPPHLKYYNLSLLDEAFQFTFVPHILFYKPSSSTDQKDDQIVATTIIINRLRRSLSKSLALYYPIAGRLTIDESAIECNDKGVSFEVARVQNCSILSFLEAPNRVDLVGRFLSKNVYDNDNNIINGRTITNTSNINTKLVPMSIQVTIFECGGFVIGSQLLHKVCDGTSWGHILKTWASLTLSSERNEDAVFFPDFNATLSVFPRCNPSEKPGRKARILVPLNDDEARAAHVADGLCIVKTFVFTPDAICALQARGSSSDAPRPTRVDAVSGFIWKHAMSAAAAARSSSSSASCVLGASVLTHAVNIRPRFREPLPSTTFGNVYIDTIAQYDPNRHGRPQLQDLVCRIRKSFSVAKDAEFLGKFIGQGGADVLREYKHKLGDIMGDSNVTTYKFTSWIGLDRHLDFGFGMPVWTGFTGGRLSSSLKNLMILMETSNGGIEAWLILDEQEMLILQADPDFLEFASLSPNIIR